MMRSESSEKGLFTIFLFYFSTDDETCNPMIARNSLRDFQSGIAGSVRSFSFVFLLCFCVVFPQKRTILLNFQQFATKRHHFTPLFTTNIIPESELKCNREPQKSSLFCARISVWNKFYFIAVTRKTTFFIYLENYGCYMAGISDDFINFQRIFIIAGYNSTVGKCVQ